MARTIHIAPGERHEVSQVTDVIDGLLAEGKRVTVTVIEDQEWLSPQQVAERLGFSRQHVMRLVGAGELSAERLTNSTYWRIPATSVLAFEERRERSRRLADEFSQSLDRLGAPLE